MNARSTERQTRRRLWSVLIVATAPGQFVSIVACGTVTDDDAGKKAVEWFENELGRIGYVRGRSETWAIAPRKVTLAIQGDELEAEIRGIAVTGTRQAMLDAKAQDQVVTWRGQVYLKYTSRERYRRNGIAREWSPWSDETSVLNVERRAGQWYVQRVR
jgi:hypothetical protein